MAYEFRAPNSYVRCANDATAPGQCSIFDEVLTGFGRTGKLFALEHFGVTPDIIVLAKAIGGGLPLGALCGSDALIGEFAHDPPLGHITTFGGHPLSCAAGLASLEVIVSEKLSERASKLGNEIVARLNDICRAAKLPPCAVSVCSSGSNFMTRRSRIDSSPRVSPTASSSTGP